MRCFRSIAAINTVTHYAGIVKGYVVTFVCALNDAGSVMKNQRVQNARCTATSELDANWSKQ
jgi:hypothetical protein